MMTQEEIYTMLVGLAANSVVKFTFLPGDLSSAMDILISVIDKVLVHEKIDPYNLKAIFTQSRGPNPTNPYVQRHMNNQVDLIVVREISVDDASNLSMLAPYCSIVTVIEAKKN